MGWNLEQVKQFLSTMWKSFKKLFKAIFSIFLISNTLTLVSVLIFIFFIPLFIIILSVPLDESSFISVPLDDSDEKIYYFKGILLPCIWLIHTNNALKGISTFKEVFSSLVIPIITAYSLKTIDTEEIPYKVRVFLTYLVLLLFLSVLSNGMIHAVDLDSIYTKKQVITGQAKKEADRFEKTFPERSNIEVSDTSNNPNSDPESGVSDSLNFLKEITANYVKDCLTYIGLTIGITLKSR